MSRNITIKGICEAKKMSLDGTTFLGPHGKPLWRVALDVGYKGADGLPRYPMWHSLFEPNEDWKGRTAFSFRLSDMFGPNGDIKLWFQGFEDMGMVIVPSLITYEDLKSLFNAAHTEYPLDSIQERL